MESVHSEGGETQESMADKYENTAENTRSALNKLAEQFSKEKLSPELREIQRIVSEMEEGESRKLSVQSMDIMAVRENGEIKFFKNEQDQRGEQILDIASWLKKLPHG